MAVLTAASLLLGACVGEYAVEGVGRGAPVRTVAYNPYVPSSSVPRPRTGGVAYYYPEHRNWHSRPRTETREFKEVVVIER